MNNAILPVILAGGSGTRLFPLSRTNYPKQFVELIGDRSLFMATVDRLNSVTELSPFVICNEEHRFLVAEQLRLSGVSEPTILLEPVGRNTAPAIALAAHAAIEQHTDPLMLIAPSDHQIRDLQKFSDAINEAVGLAEQGKIVTFGIPPTRPDTAYGYIQRKKKSSHDIEQFVEKPDEKTAKDYLASGDYLWNSGIFMIKASVYLEELKAHAADISEQVQQSWQGATIDGEFRRPDAERFTQTRSESIDYAVLEKTANVAIVPLSSDWSDLGSWDSIWSESEQDGNGNVLVGDTLAIDTKGSYVRSAGKLVAVLGCNDLIVVDTGDVMLVANKHKAQDTKNIVNALREQDRSEVDTHARVYRPWGDYEGIDRGDRYQVKRIVVTPGQKLSLQKHHHRAEHWIVVKGTAIVTCGDEERFLTENQSTYIPLGETHRLENPGSIPLELIEVQSGSYLGEDDIVRFEDIYGRDS